MSDADLRAAIEGPARQVGLLLEPGLVDLLVREVEGEPGALPLLSHALHETWQRREGRTLTVDGLPGHGRDQRLGRPVGRGALQPGTGRTAATAARPAPAPGDAHPRRRAGAQPGPPSHRRHRREHERLVELLVRARLVTSDDDTVELAHESLARAWPRLRTWLDDDVEGQRILRHLALTADAWDGMGRPDSELYRGVRLAQALEWQIEADPDLTPTERAFLDTERRTGTSRSRERRAAAPAPGPPEPAAAGSARRCRRVCSSPLSSPVSSRCVRATGLTAPPSPPGQKRSGPTRRRRRRGRGEASRSRRGGRRRPPGRRPGPARRRHRPLAAAGGRRAAARRLDRHQGQPPRRLVEEPRADRIDPRRWTGLISVGVSPDGERRRRRPRPTAAFRSTTRAPGSCSVPTTRCRSGSGSSAPTADSSLSADSPTRARDRRCSSHPCGSSIPPRSRTSRSNSAAYPRVPSYQRRTTAPMAGSWRRRSKGPTAAATRSVVVWDLASPQQPVLRFDLPGVGYELDLSPDGSRLYVGRADPPAVTAYEVATGELLRLGERAGRVVGGQPGRITPRRGRWHAMSSCWTRRPSPRCAGCRATPTGSGRSASHPAALCWRQAPTTTPAIVWDVATGERRETAAGLTPRRCGASASAPTATRCTPAAGRRC